jgi:1-acyl-sn-glycerol-3-phosphate acyltransferase
MAGREIKFEPPTGKPLGTNLAFRIAAGALRPILRAVTKPDWRGVAKIPKSGAAIVVCNHISYLDPFSFAHFLYDNGRAPRYLGKDSIFKIPLIGRFVLAAGQIPVNRESKDAIRGYENAIAALNAGHLIGIYPEGTLTRDPNLWPMVGKTGAARLALATGAPLYPCASWGPEKVIPPYGRRVKLFPRTKLSVVIGDPVDLSKWRGRTEDPVAMQEATEAIMVAITELLETLRGEKAPAERFDPRKSDLPRTGNFKRRRK